MSALAYTITAVACALAGYVWFDGAWLAGLVIGLTLGCPAFLFVEYCRHGTIWETQSKEEK